MLTALRFGAEWFQLKLMSSNKASTKTGQAAAPSLRLATFLPYRLNVLATVVSEGLARTYAERFGIGIPEWRLLATIAEFGSITAKAVAAHAHMSKVQVSRAVATLEARGLVQGASNQRDRRETLLTLTAAGTATYRDIAPLATAYADALLAVLSPEEATQLDTLITTLVRRAERLGYGNDAGIE